MNSWTIEEESILTIYNRGSRLSTLSAMEEVLPYLVDEPEMRRIMKSAIEKLEQMSDLDFLLMMLDADPLWDYENEYEEAVI